MINSVIGHSRISTAAKPFPKLMKDNDDMVVLFSSERSGCVVHTGRDNCYQVGDHKNNWSMHFFADFNEPLTLING